MKRMKNGGLIKSKRTTSTGERTQSMKYLPCKYWGEGSVNKVLALQAQYGGMFIPCACNLSVEEAEVGGPLGFTGQQVRLTCQVPDQ